PRQGVRARHPALQHRHERARAARHPARVVAEAVLSHASRATTAHPHPPARTLAWIIAFKFFKSLTLAALGVTLIAVRRSDPVDLLIRLALVVHLPLASRLLDRALSAVSSLTVARETALGIAAFGYSILMGAEGLALRSRKPWARWF